MVRSVPLQVSPAVRGFGFAIGAAFLASFGAAWIGISLRFMDWLNMASLIAVLVVTAGMVVVSGIVIRNTASEARSAENNPVRKKVNRSLGIVNAIQWTAIGIAYLLLRSVHLESYIMLAIILIVGIHFLPLGRVLNSGLHYATGIVLVFWAIASLLLFRPDSPIDGLGTGIILWISAFASLEIAVSNVGLRFQRRTL